MSSSRKLQYVIVPRLKSIKEKSFLDVACGFGLWGYKIRTHSYPSYLIGIDIWKPYLLRIKRKHIYDDLILADALHLPIRKKSIDITLACEVIEHLPKSKAELFLVSLENITMEKIIVSTPNFRYLQNETRGNPYEKHISFWKYSDFPKKYKISGVGVQIEEKIFLSPIPFFGYFLSKLVLFGKFCRFSELIVAIIDLTANTT